MKFKLDENFGRRTIELFHAAGHDAKTVFDEGLSGMPDRQSFETAGAESHKWE